MPGFGSWNWVGADLAEELAGAFNVSEFDREIPPCDVAIFVKFKPDLESLLQLGKATAVLYAPIDFYGSAAEIEADASSLRCCDRILVHCERLRRHFSAFAPVEYIDHHVKFASPFRTGYRDTGPILWVGVRSNLPPFVNWVNERRLPEELWILTNASNPQDVASPGQLGLCDHNRVRIGVWNEGIQRDWTAACRVAFDIKGDDFRARHKPPAKGIDFLASGVPLALQPDSSTAEHLARLGFEVAGVDDWEWAFSREYWDESSRFGRALRELLCRSRVSFRWRQIIQDVLECRGRRVLTPDPKR